MRDDGHLVSLALKDPTQYGKLIEKHWQTLIGLAFQKLGNLVDAEEVVQKGFVQAYRSLPSLREQNRFLPWVARIVSRMAGEEIGRRKRSGAVRLQEEIIEGAVAAAPPILSEQHNQVLHAVAELPEPYRVTMTLRFQENLTGIEIARLLGEPAGTIRSRITRGIRLLREKLEHEVRPSRTAD